MRLKRASTFLRHCLCLFIVALLFFLSGFALSHTAVTYQISGVNETVSNNIEKRLNELAKQKDNALVNIPASQIRDQVIKAIEPYGYFRARVTVTSQGNRLIIRILPGSRIKITHLKLQLTGEGSANPALLNTIAGLHLKQGDFFLMTTYNEAKEAILNTAEHNGYLRGSFSTADILINRKNYTVAINLVFNTGPQYYFGKAQFDPKYISPSLLRRYLPFQYGQPYSTDQIIALNNRLSASGYFSSVIIKPQIDTIAYVPIVVHTKPVPRYSYAIGAGYGTDTGIRGRASLHMIPVNRKGHKFNLSAQGSQKVNALQAQYLIPGKNPVTDQYALATSLGYIANDSGKSTPLLLSAAHHHTLKNYQRVLSINALFERYRYNNMPDEDNFTLFPKATWTFRKVSDPLFSPSGYNLSFNALGTLKGLGSEISIAQASVDAKAAVTFDSIRTRLYGHVIQGVTAIDQINDLPFSLSLFLGGTDNLKGYSIDSIGPGKIISFAGIEVQKETIDKWYLIGFFDAGDVYNPKPKAFNYDVGVSLMWVSPIGPVKVGVALPVNNHFQRIEGSNPRLVINMGPDL